MTTNTRLTGLLAAFVLSLGLAAPVMVQTGDGYSAEAAAVKTQEAQPSRPESAAAAGLPNSDGGTGSAHDPGNLPFTGLDLGLIAAGGSLLLGAGIGMRLLTRGAQPDRTFAPSRRQQSPAS